MKGKTGRFVAIFIMLLLTRVASTQESSGSWEMSLDELLDMQVTVASTEAENIFRSVSTVSIIDKKMIAEFNFVNISEALKTVAGFDVLRTYLKRNIPTARGITQEHYANKVLIMINNVPTWLAVTGEANIDRINIHDVERIEVLKGPASVLYGTNAYSGAVNIVLKDRAESGKFSGYMGLGDQGIFRSGGNTIFNIGEATVMVSGHAADERGHDVLFTGEKGRSGHLREYAYGNNFNISTNYKQHSFLVNAFNFHESYYGVAPYWGVGVGNDHPSEGILANYTLRSSFSSGVKLNFALTYDWNQRNLSRADDDSIRANIKGNRFATHLGLSFPIKKVVTTEVGVDYDFRKSVEYENYYPYQDAPKEDNYMANRTTRELSWFGQIGLNLTKVKFLTGLRFTNNEIYGNNLSLRGTAVIPLGQKNSFKIIAGQSYRAPSLFELYFRTSGNTVFGSTYSDEVLEPERSNSIEVAYLTSFNKFFIQLLGYAATYENKIFRDIKDIVFPDVTYPSKSVYANGDKFDAKGIELETKYQHPGFSAFFNYYFVKGGEGDALNNYYNFKAIPEHALTFGLHKKIKKLSASTVVNYQTEVTGPVNNATKTIDSQFTVDFNLGYLYEGKLFTTQQTVSVKNVFDRNIWVPEYVRRKSNGLNAVPFGYGRRILYTISFFH